MFYVIAPAFIGSFFILAAFSLALFAARDLPLAGLVVLIAGLSLAYRYFSGERARKNTAKLRNLQKSLKNNLNISEEIMVPSGERLPADGTVSAGEAVLNEFPLTGSPQQVLKRKDDPVYASTINEDGNLKIIVSRAGENTIIAKVVGLVGAAKDFPGSFQKKSVLASIVFGLIVLSVAGAYFWRTGDVGAVIRLFLVFSLDSGASFSGKVWEARSSRAALHGIIAKKISVFEKIASVSGIALDLGGYFSRSKKNFAYMRSFWGAPDNDIMALASSAEKYSNLRLAGAILAEARRRNINCKDPETFFVVKGEGVMATVSGAKIVVGGENFLIANNIHIQDEIKNHIDEEIKKGMEVALVARDNKIIGALSFSDDKKSELKNMIVRLNSLGVKEADGENKNKPVLIVGDDLDGAEARPRDVCLAIGVLNGGSFPKKAEIFMMSDSFDALERLISMSIETTASMRNAFIFLLTMNIAGMFLIWEGFIGPYGAALFHVLIESFVFIFILREAKKDKMA